MSYFSGEWKSIPVAEWERIEAVIDAARALKQDCEAEISIEFLPDLSVLFDALRALDERTGP